MDMKTPAALLMVLFATVVCAQKDPTSRAWNAPVPPFRIADNLYYVGAADITSYLITTSEGHIVLDRAFVEEKEKAFEAAVARQQNR